MPHSDRNKQHRAGAKLVLSGGRPADLVQFDILVIDFFVEAAGLLGVPKSVAAIYGVVFASVEPLSFSDITARLDISKGSVSQGLRILREMGALKEVSTKNDRTELFVPELEMRRLVRSFLETRLQGQLAAGEEQLTTIIKRVPVTGATGAELLRDRLKHLRSWHKKGRALLPMAKAFLKLTPV